MGNARIKTAEIAKSAYRQEEADLEVAPLRSTRIGIDEMMWPSARDFGGWPDAKLPEEMSDTITARETTDWIPLTDARELSEYGNQVHTPRAFRLYGSYFGFININQTLSEKDSLSSGNGRSIVVMTSWSTLELPMNMAEVSDHRLEKFRLQQRKSAHL